MSKYSIISYDAEKFHMIHEREIKLKPKMIRINCFLAKLVHRRKIMRKISSQLGLH